MNNNFKTIANLFVTSIIIITFIMLQSCKSSADKSTEEDDSEVEVKSDTSTEEKIEGTWSCTETDVDEDGIREKIYERITYNLPDHTLHSTSEYYIEGEKIFSVNIEGKWCASKDYIQEKYDISSADVYINSYFSDEVSEAEILSECGKTNYKIVELLEEKMILAEGGEEFEYRRINY